MDLWVIAAAAAGAGYLAKYLSGESESSSGNSTTQQSDFKNLLQLIRDQTCPFRRWSRRSVERESSERGEGISDEKKFNDASTSGSDAKMLVNNGNYENYNVFMMTSLLPEGKESFQEGSVDEGFGNCGDALTELDTTTRLSRRHLRNRSHEHYAKPLNSLESCLAAQLYRDQERGEEYLKQEQIGMVELPRKQEQRLVKGQLGISNTRLSLGPFPSQGLPKGMLLFVFGITIGIIWTRITDKKEMDNLDKMLKRNENLVKDLQEELEMKAMLTEKEIAGGYHQSQVTTDCSSGNLEPVASSSKQESAEHERREPEDREVESHELMSKIEAELEAELERLELNMKASSFERISDFVEFDPKFEPEVIQGDLKVGLGQSQPDSDASVTSPDHSLTANYAVSPRELSLRLHEVIESRLATRIEELEAALQNSQKKVHSLEWHHLISQKKMASSTPGNPNIIEVHESEQPFEINLSGGGLAAYNEAHEEIIWVADSDQETPDAAGGNSHNEEGIPHYHKQLGEGQNKGPDNLIGTLEERILRSQGSSEVAVESEERENDDEILIRQIVNKSRQGLSLVLNSG